MKKIICLSTLLFCSSNAIANVHFSPDLKMGSLWGVGVQLGQTDVLGYEAIYGSFGITESHWFSDREAVKHYRVGVQYQQPTHETYSVQLEAGLAKYKGSRDYFGRDSKELTAYGPSIAAALVFDYNSPIQVRYGLEVGYFRHQDTFLPSGLSPQLSVGVSLPL
ncbi:hypothetical protein LRP49_16000 [Enterovibrio sp. ZSDZ35]|uniref:Outer membrane protein beta-barrel domain-containing protein n=1 Tax=Enterovibrio qingdaonensis TaxID=2899818 RepID=A0ABT5QNW2_9GAMM|nr:hypothetical protein [Enterovibrio sp. ZSDZ35]MDD1782675.1 hypothetical protein [Enterovibrio sp. ZSDZ35]